MSKVRAKFFIFLVALGIMIPLALLGVALTGQFVFFFQQGANPASIFHGNELILPEPAQARWLPLTGYGGSTPSQAQAEELLAAYWEAWTALERSHLTGDTSNLLTHWAGDAYQQALQAVDPADHVQMTHSSHQLRLTFFSDDGSVAAFDDLNFLVEYTTAGSTTSLNASASIVMTLDTGFWRIRSLTVAYR